MSIIQFTDDDDPVDIRFDNVFKAVFTRDSPASMGALSKLVSALIEREVSVAAITANEPPVDNLNDRQIRFDINCRAENGEYINVEMSFYPRRYEPIRLEYHAAKLFTGQGIRGQEKSYNNLKETYQITILGNDRFFPDDEFYHSFEYYDPVNETSLRGKSRIITLELSKIGKLVEKPVQGRSPRENWAVYFQFLTDRSKRRKINEIVETEEGIAMASEVLLNISRDEIERARLFSEEKYQLDRQSELVCAKEDGLQEGLQKGLERGREEGLEKGREEIARKALDEGASIEFVRKITGLSAEEIEKL